MKPAKSEISAGGLVYRDKHGIEILMIQDYKDKWTFPKGLIEYGENPPDAAKREIEEETSVTNIKLIKELCLVTYTYKHKRSIIDKTVHYFLFKTNVNQKPIPQKEEGIKQALFIPFEKAKSLIGYAKSNKIIIDSFIKYLGLKNG